MCARFDARCHYDESMKEKAAELIARGYGKLSLSKLTADFGHWPACGNGVVCGFPSELIGVFGRCAHCFASPFLGFIRLLGNEVAHAKAHAMNYEGGGHHTEWVETITGHGTVHHEGSGRYETVEAGGHWE